MTASSLALAQSVLVLVRRVLTRVVVLTSLVDISLVMPLPHGMVNSDGVIVTEVLAMDSVLCKLIVDITPSKAHGILSAI